MRFIYPFKEIKKFQINLTKEFREFDRRFNKFFKGSKLLGIKSKESISKISDKKDNIIISLDMPGMDRKDIYVKVDKNNVEVKGIKKHHIKLDKKESFREERSVKSFYKKISLPEEVIPEKATTHYTGNTLTIKVPKAKKKAIRKAKILVK